jgi:hypothetical protein
MILTRINLLGSCRPLSSERLLGLNNSTSHFVFMAITISGMIYIMLHVGDGTGGPLVKSCAEGIINWISHGLLFLLKCSLLPF